MQEILIAMSLFPITNPQISLCWRLDSTNCKIFHINRNLTSSLIHRYLSKATNRRNTITCIHSQETLTRTTILKTSNCSSTADAWLRSWASFLHHGPSCTDTILVRDRCGFGICALLPVSSLPLLGHYSRPLCPNSDRPLWLYPHLHLSGGANQ